MRGRTNFLAPPGARKLTFNAPAIESLIPSHFQTSQDSTQFQTFQDLHNKKKFKLSF